MKKPFVMPGGDLGPKPGLVPGVNDDIFRSLKGMGGGFRRSNPEPAPEPEIEQVPSIPPPPPPEAPLVTLSNPKWGVDSAHFEERVSLSVDVSLPESLKEIKRVVVTVFALSPNGAKSQIKSRDLYVDKGKVQGEFDLERPPKQEGKEVASCPYVFTAKHRDSKEVESPKLPVKDKPKGNEELILEFVSSKELKTGGFAFQLKSKDGSVNSKIETKDGIEKEGKLTLKFTELDPKLEYKLDMLDAQGKTIEPIFSDTKFGKWADGTK